MVLMNVVLDESLLEMAAAVDRSDEVSPIRG
jgi:hypothetical protein